MIAEQPSTRNFWIRDRGDFTKREFKLSIRFKQWNPVEVAWFFLHCIRKINVSDDPHQNNRNKDEKNNSEQDFTAEFHDIPLPPAVSVL